MDLIVDEGTFIDVVIGRSPNTFTVRLVSLVDLSAVGHLNLSVVPVVNEDELTYYNCYLNQLTTYYCASCLQVFLTLATF